VILLVPPISRYVQYRTFDDSDLLQLAVREDIQRDHPRSQTISVDFMNATRVAICAILLHLAFQELEMSKAASGISISIMINDRSQAGSTHGG